MVNVSAGLYNLKTKVDELRFGNLKTVHVDLRTLSEVVSKEVVKQTKLKKLNTKVNNLENKIPDPHKININTEQVNKVWQRKWISA